MHRFYITSPKCDEFHEFLFYKCYIFVFISFYHKTYLFWIKHCIFHFNWLIPLFQYLLLVFVRVLLCCFRKFSFDHTKQCLLHVVTTHYSKHYSHPSFFLITRLQSFPLFNFIPCSLDWFDSNLTSYLNYLFCNHDCIILFLAKSEVAFPCQVLICSLFYSWFFLFFCLFLSSNADLITCYSIISSHYPVLSCIISRSKAYLQSKQTLSISFFESLDRRIP